jgi:hypothetical protein
VVDPDDVTDDVTDVSTMIGLLADAHEECNDALLNHEAGLSPATVDQALVWIRRAVRIEGIVTLVAASPKQMGTAGQTQWRRCRLHCVWRHTGGANSDRPYGKVQLGDCYRRVTTLHRGSSTMEFERLGSSPRARKVVWVLLALSVSPLLVAACSSSTTASSSTTTVSIPSGWKVHTYGKMAIATPGNWAVKQEDNCPDPAAPGTLHLGLPAVDFSCPASPPSIGSVVVWPLNSGTSTKGEPSGQKPVAINGVPVNVEIGSTTLAVWTVPSLGVQITGTGTNSIRVMHTLHKA